MKFLRLLFAILALTAPAQAQNNFTMPPPGGVVVIGAQVVATCGVGALSATQGFVSINTLGQLCTNATGGTSSGISYLGITTRTGSAWTSATAANATQVIFPSTTTDVGPPFVAVQFDQTTTISAGQVTFEGTFDGTNWVTIPVAQVFNATVGACSVATNPYTLQQSTNQPLLIYTQGYQAARIKLSTQITGSGSVTPFFAALNYLPFDPALCNPLVAGTAIIGKVGLDQTTMGTTNGVAPAGVGYETVAASATAQVLGGAGATGDYLSHCVIYPVTTAAGSVTVFDNTNAAGTNVITFTAGTLSNLAPIAIPVGAISTAGPWKVTTGANETVTCYGKFSP